MQCRHFVPISKIYASLQRHCFRKQKCGHLQYKKQLIFESSAYLVLENVFALEVYWLKFGSPKIYLHLLFLELLCKISNFKY